MKTAWWSSLAKHRELALLVLRLGLGVMLIFRGYPLLFGGSGSWRRLGSGVGSLGFEVPPEVWGLLAALTLFGGGVLFILGLFFRPAALGLLITLAVTVLLHWRTAAGPLSASPWLEAAFVAFALLVLGPGRHSVDGS